MVQMALSLIIRLALYGFLAYYLIGNAATSVGQIGAQWGLLATVMAWPLHERGTVSTPAWFLLCLLGSKHLLGNIY